MTDFDMEKLCAKAMGKSVYPCNGIASDYFPLVNDAQALALVKNVELIIWPPRFNKGKVNWVVRAEDDNQNVIAQTASTDLNRAIVECVAKMQAAKS